MKRRTIAIVMTLTLAAAVTLFYFLMPRPSSHASVETLTVLPSDITLVASVAGTIEPHAQVSIGSRASGEVIEVAVEEGATVAEGDVLFRLDRTDAERQVATAEIDLARLRAGLAQARAELSSAELASTDDATTADLAERTEARGLTTADASRSARHARDLARATVSLRRASLSAARAQVDAAALAVDEARRNLERTEIRAPFAGTVLSVDVERGTIVSSAIGSITSTTLATLADLSDLRMIGQLDESQVGAVAVGQEVTFRVDAYPTRTFAGRVQRVSPLGVEQSSVVVFDVEILVTDPDARLLRSGMSADADIVTSRETAVLAIPLAALRSRNGAREVVLPDGTSRVVTTGATDGERIVIASGLSAGDEIVADALSVREAAPERASSGLLPTPPRGGGSRPSGGAR